MNTRKIPPLAVVVALVASFAMLPVVAGTFNLVKAPVTAADWTDPEFYDDNGAPTGAASDIVCTTPAKHLEIAIDGNDADFPAITNFLNSIHSFKYGSATITITVPEGRVMTLKRPFYDLSSDVGRVYKYGTGELVLDSIRQLSPDSTSSNDHQGDWRVMEGTLRVMPSAPTGSYWWMMDFNYVAEGAKIVLPVTGGDGGAWQILEVTGGGTITNESTVATRIYKNSSGRTEVPVFSGNIGPGNISFYVRSSDMEFSGTNNTAGITTGTSNGKTNQGTLHLYQLGNTDATASSMGLGSALLPSRFVYTGPGEVSNRRPYVHYLDSFISGGTNGNLRLTGSILNHWSSETRNNSLVLGGDNLHPCWFESAIDGWLAAGQRWDLYLEKTGCGQWNLENKYSTFAGTVAVKDGVLGCGLLGRRGEISTIGTSTNCHERVAQYDDSNAVDYAIMLGDAEDAEAEGLLENTSEDAMVMVDRPFALAGRGGFRQNAGEGVVKYANVKGLGAGAKTLVLDGSSPSTNQVYDVADGEGTVSVLKRGAGTWLLGGDLTFSGGLTVEGGTLIVKRAPEDKYGFYRFTVKEIASYHPDFQTPSSVASDNDKVYMTQIGLWAADATRQDMNIRMVRQGALVPGSGTFALAWNRAYSGEIMYHGFNRLEMLFCGSRSPKLVGYGETTTNQLWNMNNTGFTLPGGGAMQPGPHRGDPLSWLSFDICLPDTAKPIALFDIGSSGAAGTRYDPAVVQLFGSVDGVHWEDLSGEKTGLKTTGNYRWISTNTSIDGNGTTSGYGFFDQNQEGDWHANPALSTYNRATGGFTTTNTVPMRRFHVLESVGAVKVASGATLKFVGERAPAISRLEVDPTSGGTIDGFALAAEGTLNLPIDDFDGQTLALPIAFANMGTSAFSGWSLSMNGVAKSRSPRFRCRNGVLTVYKAGTTIYLR